MQQQRACLLFNKEYKAHSYNSRAGAQLLQSIHQAHVALPRHGSCMEQGVAVRILHHISGF